MLNGLFAGLIVCALIFAVCGGRIPEVSAAALDGGLSAVELSIRLCGGLCLWSGIMRIAERSGLAQAVSRGFSPVIRLLFPKVEPGSEAGRLIGMNLAANLLGLGNAVTPLGIAAMRELEKQNDRHSRASDPMVMFVVLNTASLQLIPASTAVLRLAAGSAAPMEIVPAVWLASLCSVASGILSVWLLAPFFRGRPL